MRGTFLFFVVMGFLFSGGVSQGCEDEVAAASGPTEGAAPTSATPVTRQGILDLIVSLKAADARLIPHQLAARLWHIVGGLEQVYPPPAGYRPYAWAGTPPGMTFDDAELFAATHELREKMKYQMDWSFVSVWIDVVEQNLGRRPA